MCRRMGRVAEKWSLACLATLSGPHSGPCGPKSGPWRAWRHYLGRRVGRVGRKGVRGVQGDIICAAEWAVWPKSGPWRAWRHYLGRRVGRVGRKVVPGVPGDIIWAAEWAVWAEKRSLACLATLSVPQNGQAGPKSGPWRAWRHYLGRRVGRVGRKVVPGVPGDIIWA